MVIPMLFFAIPLLLLILSERKWRKHSLPLLNEEKRRKLDYELNKEKFQSKYREEMASHNEELERHPFHKANAEIETNFPLLWPTLEELRDLETNFAKKWKQQ